MAAAEEFPGMSEAVQELAEKAYESTRAVLLDPDKTPLDSLPDDFEPPAPWGELDPFQKTAFMQNRIPTVMLVYPHIAAGVRSQVRAEAVTKLYSPKVKQSIIDLLPDSIENKDIFLSAIIGIIDEAQSED